MSVQERNTQGISQEIQALARDENLRLYDKAIQAIEGQRYLPLPTSELNLRAQLQIGFGEHGLALQTLRNITRPTEAVINTYILLANAIKEKGDVESAISVLDTAAGVAGDVMPDRDGFNVADSFMAISTGFADLGKAGRAISALDYLKGSLDVGRNNTLYQVAYNLAASGNEEGALEVVNELIDESEKAYALSRIEEAYAKKGDFESWERIRAINATPNIGRVRAFLAGAEFYLANEDSAKSREMILQAAGLITSLDCGPIGTLWQMQLVDFALEEGSDIVTAVEVADQMVPDSHTVYSYNDIAKAQHLSGDTEGAIATLQKSKERALAITDEVNMQRRKNARLRVYTDLAGTHFSVGNIDEGEKFLKGVEKAIRDGRANLYDLIEDQTSRGNFELALRLAEFSSEGRWRGV